MKKLVIFGIADVGRLAHFYFTRHAGREVAGFTVERAYRAAETFLGLPLVDFEGVTEAFPPGEHDLFVAVGYRGMNRVRAERYARAKELGYVLPSYVSPHCTLLTQEPIGDNCLILEDNTIQPFVTIGNDVTLWSGNHIGHDSVVEDHCFITSHVVVSGHVRVGAYTFIGVNATLRNSINIAPETLIGAGALIMKDTVPKGVYMPQRAELFKKKSDQIEI